MRTVRRFADFIVQKHVQAILNSASLRDPSLLLFTLLREPRDVVLERRMEKLHAAAVLVPYWSRIVLSRLPNCQTSSEGAIPYWTMTGSPQETAANSSSVNVNTTVFRSPLG